MNKEQAKEILRDLAKHGCIIISNHCRTKMRERNVSTEDILHVLMWGDIKNIEKDSTHDDWKVEVKNFDLDDVELTVHVAVNENTRTIIIITVY